MKTKEEMFHSMIMSDAGFEERLVFFEAILDIRDILQKLVPKEGDGHGGGGRPEDQAVLLKKN